MAGPHSGSGHNFERIPVIDSDPYDYGTPLRPAGATGVLAPGTP